MVRVDCDNTIHMTRGNSAYFEIGAFLPDKTQYTPSSTDKVVFTAKAGYEDKHAIIRKEIPVDTMLLELETEDTAYLDFGVYVYDIYLQTLDGSKDTFIREAKLVIERNVG